MQNRPCAWHSPFNDNDSDYMLFHKVRGAFHALVRIDLVLQQRTKTDVERRFAKPARFNIAVRKPDSVAPTAALIVLVKRRQEFIVGEDDGMKRSVQFGRATDAAVRTKRNGLGKVAQGAGVVAEDTGFGGGELRFHFVGGLGLCVVSFTF